MEVLYQLSYPGAIRKSSVSPWGLRGCSGSSRRRPRCRGLLAYSGQSPRNLRDPIGNDDRRGRLAPTPAGRHGRARGDAVAGRAREQIFTFPLGHSPDIRPDRRQLGWQAASAFEVKTSISRLPRERWQVSIATRGGNQSWTGVVKCFDPARCDYLFVHVADGRRWFIPAGELDGHSGLHLGGPKYSEFEVESGSPRLEVPDPPLESQRSPGECPSGQPGGAVNAMALPSQVRILPPPSPHPDRRAAARRQPSAARGSPRATRSRSPSASVCGGLAGGRATRFRVEASRSRQARLTRSGVRRGPAAHGSTDRPRLREPARLNAERRPRPRCGAAAPRAAP